MYRMCLTFAFGISAATLSAFEKIALVDSFDETRFLDMETMEGTDKFIDYVLGTGATQIFWRNQSGANPRYPSAEEDRRAMAYSLDKRRVGGTRVFDWARLDRGETNLLAYALASIRQRGVVDGIHLTFEENHWGNCTFGPWNWEHPQYWCRSLGGTPWPGRCSYVYDEVLAHKMRLLDELVATGAETLYLDLWRDGYWSPHLEYTPKMVEEFRREYGRMPTGDAREEEWLRLVSKYTHRYIRAVRARCDAAPRRVKLILALKELLPDDVRSRNWEHYAIDWCALAKEGVFDGIAAMSVEIDGKDPFGSTRRCYEAVRAAAGDVPVYGHCSAYNRRYGISKYAESAGVTDAEAAKRLCETARNAGCAGVVMEVVDFGNYKPDVMKAIKNF